ncbi:discoidin domain-containing protein [Streptomyces sp. NPDC057927]
MKSDKQDGFISKVSSEHSGYRAFDGDDKTYYRSSIIPNLPEYLSIEFPKKYKIGKYTIKLGASYYGMLTWEFEGLVDGSWISLHSGSHPHIEETLTFEFKPIEVSSARIKCKTRQGTNSWGLFELNIFEYVTNEKVLILDGNSEVKSVKPSVKLAEISTPKMTSNTAPSGKAFCKDFLNSGYQPFFAFNQTDDSEGYCSGSTSKGVGYIGYEFPTVKVIGKYILRSGSGSAYIKKMPKDWTFEGSNDSTNGDDGTWDVLDKQVNQSWINVSTDKTYLTNIKKPYKMYRLIFTSNSDNNTSYTNLNEFKMFETIFPTLTTVSSTSEDNFLKYGMDKSTTIDLTEEITTRKLIEQSPTVLGNGKVFKKSIDTSKIPIKKVEIK